VESAGTGFRFLKTGFRFSFCRVKWLFENFEIDQLGTKSDTNLDKSDTIEDLTSGAHIKKRGEN